MTEIPSGVDDLTARGLYVGPDGLVRPQWARGDLLTAYYDTEWGTPVRDERGVFTRLCLESLQCGLAWVTILRKRPALTAAFAGFDPDALTNFDEDDVDRLMANPDILRNRAKIEAVITNAHACVGLRRSGGLADLVWSFHDPGHPAPWSSSDIPSATDASRELARQLKSAGFRFVGPVTTYAAMQAIGVVNDHIIGTHRRPTA